jgi:protein gp37
MATNSSIEWTEATWNPVTEAPLQWRRPKRIFVNSMSDLFRSQVPDSFIDDVFDVMRRADWHQFQILTKRSQRLLDLDTKLPWKRNVWMGVSVENHRFVHRIDDLRKTHAPVCRALTG